LAALLFDKREVPGSNLTIDMNLNLNDFFAYMLNVQVVEVMRFEN